MAATTSRPTCPGVDPDSVEVTVEHSTLTIRAERTPHYGESEQVIVAERPQGSFTRQLSLGEGVDSENLTAAYADGVLHLIIPVSPKTQARRVEITHAPGGSRTISGRTADRVRRPPAAPAGAEHRSGQAGAGHHGLRAGAGLGPAENDELAATRWRPDGLLSPDGHTRHRRPGAIVVPNRHRRIASPASRCCAHRPAPEVVPVTRRPCGGLAQRRQPGPAHE
jgi:Hsp20/alpha crystallin family